MKTQPTIRPLIKALFDDQHLAVLSTCSRDGHPYASLVCVVAEADLSGIFFATSRDTHKYDNLCSEPRVALLVENSRNQPSDIYEAMAITALGAATELKGDIAKAAGIFLQTRHTELGSFIDQPSTAMFRMAVRTFYVVDTFQKVREYKLKVDAVDSQGY